MGGRSVADALTAAVRDLVADIDRGSGPALADEADAVHQLRTSVRRLRTVLIVHGRWFRGEEPAALREGLEVCGRLLGECRDTEVSVAYGRQALEDLGLDLPELLADPIAAHGDAHARWVAWAHGPSARALLADLQAWAREPRLRKKADRSASAVAREAVRRERHRVLKRVRRVDDLDGEAAHDLRKAARRLRHVADLAEHADLGRHASPVARAGRLGRDIQGLLGEHRDATLLATHAGSLADQGDPRLHQVVVWAERRAGRAAGGLPRAVLALRETDKI